MICRQGNTASAPFGCPVGSRRYGPGSLAGHGDSTSWLESRDIFPHTFDAIAAPLYSAAVTIGVEDAFEPEQGKNRCACAGSRRMACIP